MTVERARMTLPVQGPVRFSDRDAAEEGEVRFAGGLLVSDLPRIELRVPVEAEAEEVAPEEALFRLDPKSLTWRPEGSATPEVDLAAPALADRLRNALASACGRLQAHLDRCLPGMDEAARVSIPWVRTPLPLGPASIGSRRAWRRRHDDWLRDLAAAEAEDPGPEDGNPDDALLLRRVGGALLPLSRPTSLALSVEGAVSSTGPVLHLTSPRSLRQPLPRLGVGVDRLVVDRDAGTVAPHVRWAVLAPHLVAAAVATDELLASPDAAIVVEAFEDAAEAPIPVGRLEVSAAGRGLDLAALRGWTATPEGHSVAGLSLVRFA